MAFESRSIKGKETWKLVRGGLNKKTVGENWFDEPYNFIHLGAPYSSLFQSYALMHLTGEIKLLLIHTVSHSHPLHILYE